MSDLTKRLALIGQIRDLVGQTTPQAQPFLYHLPILLAQPQFAKIDAAQALVFTRLALSPDKIVLITDALCVLDQIVSPEGILIVPRPDFFQENRTFFWKELGGHIQPTDVISHILNKVLFVTSLGK